MSEKQFINFYSTRDAYGAFSNFAKFGVEMDNSWWPTVEHYFQAQKFRDAEIQERIRTAHSPKEAANLGRSRDFPLRSDWETIKRQVMYAAVLKKFQSHEAPRRELLATGNAIIQETAPGDYYWGTGKDFTGRNELGKILMRVRSALRNSGNETL